MKKYAQLIFIAALLLCLTPWISAPMALVGGFLMTFFFGNPFPQLTGKTTSWLLKGSVVGLGFGMNAYAALEAGSQGLWLTIGSVTLVLTLGFVVGRWLRLPRRLSHLVASGTAICGGSAIAAVAPAVRADKQETSMALGVVFALNSIALLLFPFLGHCFGLTQEQFGLWSAIAIHDTSSVVGASSAYGEEALRIATTVKLARALWIIPVSLLSAIWFRNTGKRIAVPWFIALFIGAMLVNTFVPSAAEISPYIFSLSKRLLVVTLFLIGASLSVAAFRQVGVKPLVLGVTLWTVISCASLAVILWSA